MFTGLVERCGVVRTIRARGPGTTLTIGVPGDFVGELGPGESVALDGACLTVTTTEGEAFAVDASAETMRRTTLGDRHVGDEVHLERALRLGDRLGGHLVSGHIDDTGVIVRRRPLGEALLMTFKAPPSVHRYLISKGSIAVDGVSLTVNEVDPDGRCFSVVLIPHTQGIVHLHKRPEGARVNLESDMVGKYIERLLGRAPLPGGLTMEDLAKAGFTPHES